MAFLLFGRADSVIEGVGELSCYLETGVAVFDANNADLCLRDAAGTADQWK